MHTDVERFCSIDITSSQLDVVSWPIIYEKWEIYTKNGVDSANNFYVSSATPALKL